MEPTFGDDLPGIAFEKLVAALQARIDPASTVTHNEVLLDRLGHSRQFDVVIRGKFAGQEMLGVIECKDLKKKVGNPEVDAFVTKARDVNANFKILVSRSGFTAPALEKCADYGIQALSLLKNDAINKNFFIGTRCTADHTRWQNLSVSLHFVNLAEEQIVFSVEELKVNGKRVIDGFTNWMLSHERDLPPLGWVQVMCDFEVSQIVEIRPGVERLCQAISFTVERVCDRLEYRTAVTGDGFFNWNLREATYAPDSTYAFDPIPTDFNQWKPRSDDTWPKSGFIEMHLEVSSRFEQVEDALDLDSL